MCHGVVGISVYAYPSFPKVVSLCSSPPSSHPYRTRLCMLRG